MLARRRSHRFRLTKRVTTLAVACVLVPAAAAHATTIAFDDLASPSGTKVATQYAPAISFVSDFRDPSQPSTNGQIPELAHGAGRSAPNAITLPPTGSEFVKPDFAARFTTTRKIVSLWARDALTDGATEIKLKLTLFDANAIAVGSQQVSLSRSAGVPSAWTQLTATSASENVAAFTVQALDGTDSAGGHPVQIDDLTFDDPVVSSPDFSVSTTQPIYEGSPGATLGAVDGIRLNRINGSTGSIIVTATGLPPGVTASFLPNPVPGTQSSTTMTLSVGLGAPPAGSVTTPLPFTITATGSPPAAPAAGTARSVPVGLVIDQALTVVTDPAGPVTLDACGETDLAVTVRRAPDVGAAGATLAVTAPTGVTATLDTATIAPGGTAHLHVFAAPAATSGAISITASLPGRAAGVGTIPLTIAPRLWNTCFRRSNGFKFPNYDWTFDLGHWVDLYGLDQFLIHIDPCNWFGASCPLPTGIPDPLAAGYVALWSTMLGSAHGSCFGMVLAAERIAAGQMSIAPFTPAGAPDPWSLDVVPGAQPLGSVIAAQHVAQASAEFLDTYLGQRAATLTGIRTAGSVVRTIAAEVAAQHPVGISIGYQGKGHVLEVYRVRQESPTSWLLDVYDVNVPYDAAEDTDSALADGNTGKSTLRIHTGPDTPSTRGYTWSYVGGFGLRTMWHGGMQDLTDFTAADLPVRPTLPGSNDWLNQIVAFGSGAPAQTPPSSFAQIDALDAGASASGVFAASGQKPVSLPTRPDTSGKTDVTVLGKDRGGRMIATGGLHGTFTSSGDDDQVGFAAAPSPARETRAARAKGASASPSVRLWNESTAGGTQHVASVAGGAPAGSKSTLGVSSSGVVYTHSGAPTTASFSFSAAGSRVDAAAFQTAAMRVTAGERITFTVPWRGLATGAVTARVRRGGHTISVKLRRSGTPPVRVTQVRVSARRATGSGGVGATVSAHFSGRLSAASAAVSVAAFSGKKVVARAQAVVASGKLHASRVTRLTLNGVPRGRITIRARVQALVTAPLPVTSTGSASASLPAR